MVVYQDIAHYSKERKISLIRAIEKINWDTNYNPEEFLQLLTSNQSNKNWALTKMLAYMPYATVRRLVTKEFLQANISDKIISRIYPSSRQQQVRAIYSKL